MPAAPRTRILILGGGFAGVSAAMRLRALLRRDPAVEIHLVSNENYFVFQPLLPEVVACRIEPTHIVNPIRQLCRGVVVTNAEVQRIDLAVRTVELVGADARRVQTLGYDQLVIALGLTMDLSRIPGMREHSLPIKNLGDAFHLRNHVLQRLEEADVEPDERQRRRLLTFVAVGGGFSGVETGAELNDMVKGVLRFFPRAAATGHRLILVHSQARILNELRPELADFARRKLEQRGVEVLVETRVKECTAGGVILGDGREIEAATVVCTVGNSPHPVITSSALPQERGRVLVDECMRAQGLSGVWAVGDSALLPDVKRGGFCPPTAQYATRQGKRVADNIHAALRGGQARPFVFGGLGQLAIVGHQCGVAQVMGLMISGRLAWFLWRTVYFMKLPGVRAKLRVGIDWALDVFFPRDIAMLDVRRTERLGRAHYKAGEVIIRQGEIGDRFYIIESGEVEVVRTGPDGAEQRLATRKAGESFGEVALLRGMPRTATVRCLSPVNVITFNRDDFRTLVGSSEVFRVVFEQQMQAMSPPASEPRPPQTSNIASP
ncbi:MAG TPA: FAD-dependent oxidoreductase [Phycisphaerae bacterium]|nr:FAD-dependent oxidoreductase [Phycisphaerae bacterium]